MSVHKSAEDYLEAILLIKQKRGCVRSIDIVNLLGFSKPSVSVAMKNLRTNGFIEVSGDGNICLLEPGRKIAQELFERHTMLTSCLAAIGVPEEIAAEDACRIEHVISKESFEAIKESFNRHTNFKGEK